MDEALADATVRAGLHLACRQGCTQCCQGAFVVSPLDALRLRAGMEALQASNPELAAEIKHRAEMWVVEYGASFPGNLETGLLGDTPEERARFEDFADDAACPALDPESGRCDIYAWRPMTCRVFGPPVRMGDGTELAHCELCFIGAGKDEVAACEMTVPYDLEADLLNEISSKGETVVAFALLG